MQTLEDFVGWVKKDTRSFRRLDRKNSCK